MERQGSVSSQLSHVSAATMEFNHQDIHANCPEKIIFCVDLADDVLTTTVKTKEKGEMSLLAVWKNALELFVSNKHMLNNKHEFAIVILNDKAQWFCDFNDDPILVCNAISQLESVEESYESFDLASLYSIIYENCCPPPPAESPVLPPPFVVRAIFLYGRRHCLPVYRGDVKAHNELTESPYFFLDVLYSHDPPAPRNMCTGIFDILSELYTKPKAMVLDWSVGAAVLFGCFAKLLAHPLQRPMQTLMEHKLQTTSSLPPAVIP